KMSKKLKNYPDPMDVVEQYGADAVRYYLLSSPVIRGEDLRFSVRGVEDVSKKLLMRLDNVRSFYQLYAPTEFASHSPSRPQRAIGVHVQQTLSEHILDRWILSRLNQLIQETTAGFEHYELDNATRPLMEFVDDLSNWYVRRSRGRFKQTDEGAPALSKVEGLVTLRHILYTLSHVLAPSMPFFADYLFREMREESDVESVHLANWPAAGSVDTELIADMKRVRVLVSQALQLREKEDIKIRQPLAMLKAKKLPATSELRELLKDEVNVKEVVEDGLMEEDVWLDTELTDVLRTEGVMRDIVRKIQDWRKEQKMQISDRPSYILHATAEEKKAAETYRAEIIAQTGLADLKVELGKDA
ncbi:MAG: class I tRNA ligase family protein, partial [Patescibacteria group bacterium]|nr:class I tRNA ligase family protein [Patescibacteria group bacterium]